MLLEDEQMYKMTTMSLKIVEVDILSENFCPFVSCSAFKKSIFSELEISRVSGTTKDKSKVEILQNFVAFSEYINFTTPHLGFA